MGGGWISNKRSRQPAFYAHSLRSIKSSSAEQQQTARAEADANLRRRRDDAELWRARQEMTSYQEAGHRYRGGAVQVGWNKSIYRFNVTFAARQLQDTTRCPRLARGECGQCRILCDTVRLPNHSRERPRRPSVPRSPCTPTKTAWQASPPPPPGRSGPATEPADLPTATATASDCTASPTPSP